MEMPFMVTFKTPAQLTDDFLMAVQDQNALIERYTHLGKVLGYYVSIESGYIWLICQTPDECTLLEFLAGLPLTKYMKATLHPMTYYQAAFPMMAVHTLN